MQESLLDTDILNEVLKQRNTNVNRHATAYLAQHKQFAISAANCAFAFFSRNPRTISYQVIGFAKFCRNTTILVIEERVLDIAADLWAEGRRQGRTPNDADLFIAATAMHYGQVLVSGNTSHFHWISGLMLANWRDT